MLVRVSMDDEPVTVNSAAFFQTFFDPIKYSVVPHLSDCSGGRGPNFVPYYISNVEKEAETVPVLSVHVNGTSTSYTRRTILDAAEAVIKDQLGLSSPVSLSATVDHAIFCVPSGLSGPMFYASAPLHSYWSMAKQSWCTNAMALQHELLHNLGLGHAGRRNDAISDDDDDDNDIKEYGDKTSLMGPTHRVNSSVPSRYRCLNGQNYYKLGWFADYTVEVNLVLTTNTLKQKTSAAINTTTLELQQSTPFLVGGSTAVELVSITEPHKCNRDQALIIKVLDLYLVYNRQSGYNRDTGVFPDRMTIVRETEDGIDSLLLAGLNNISPESGIFRYTTSISASTSGLQSNPIDVVVTIQICDHLHGNATHPYSRGDWFGRDAL